MFRNPQLNESHLTQSRRLLELWKLSVSRESTTQTRNAIVKVYKQPLVMRQARLKLMLSQHPNAPPPPKS